MPAAPGNLVAKASPPTRIDLAWQDAATNETAYVVERSSNGWSYDWAFTPIATLPANATSYADTSLPAPGAMYYYRVAAKGDGGTSDYSNVASASAAAPAAANFQGLWWKSPGGSESGWGINFAHQGDVIFATWFTFDANGKPWWLIAELHKSAAGIYSGNVATVSGPAFNATPWDKSKVKESVVGTMTASFTTANDGTLAYTVNGISQTKAITRQAFGPLPVCSWGTQPDLSRATNFQDLWWSAPAGGESGWGVNLTHQADIIFATWFTYDAAGKPWWLVAEMHRTLGNAYSGNVSTVTGPAFSAVPFDPAKVRETTVGTATVTFAHGNSGSFAYNVNGVSQTKSITRQVFRGAGHGLPVATAGGDAGVQRQAALRAGIELHRSVVVAPAAGPVRIDHSSRPATGLRVWQTSLPPPGAAPGTNPEP